MKWLKSTTSKAYTAQGLVIPPNTKAPVAVNDVVYEKIMAMSVIKSLVATGGILVLDKYTELGNTVDAQTRKLQSLTEENTKLATRIRELESQTPAEEPASTKAVKAAKKAQSEAEQKLAELQAQYDALKAEAEEKIAALQEGKE